MIKSEIVKIKKLEKFDNIYIEKELLKLGKAPLRWAITDIVDDYLIISVSYVEND
ncbi:unknown [Clostridium sp. CAG:967]|nr:unknown [Clostridium sp. CAG:967]